MEYRSLATGAAAASAAAHILSAAAALLSLQEISNISKDLNSPEYLVLLMWVAVAVVSSVCFAAVLVIIMKAGRSMYRFEAVDCYQIGSKGAQRNPEGRPKGKNPQDRTQ
ncbi:MAG: hypothetical protein AB7D42_03460 [Candidatus Methanomethylophilaceae archaeon]|nr:hypothetical protein [Candidatus Methanomethylophilaceae archaeon]